MGYFRGFNRVFSSVACLMAFMLMACPGALAAPDKLEALRAAMRKADSPAYQESLQNGRLVTHEDVERLMDAYIKAHPVRPRKAKQAAAPRITGFTPIGGRPGTSVAITGEHFSTTPEANTVFFSDTPAVVTSATETELVAAVPEGALSGRIRVVTSLGAATSRRDFLVMNPVSGTFEPPVGVPSGTYYVVNTFTVSALSAGEFSVDAPAGRMSLLAAVNPDTEENNNYLAFYAPDFLNQAPARTPGVAIDAYSTAEALVFLHPLLMTPDPVAALRLRNTMLGVPEVQALAQVVAQRYPAGADGLDDPDVEAAWSSAVEAVIETLPESMDVQSGQPPERVVSMGAPAFNAHINDVLDPDGGRETKGYYRVGLDMDYADLQVENGNPVIGYQLSCNYSPVDFLVGLWRLDPDKMPQGVNPPYEYVKGYDFETLAYHEVVAIEANQWTAKIDVLGQVLDTVTGGIYSAVGIEGGDPEFELPTLAEDSVYISRAFSGGWKDHMQSPSDDYAGLKQVPESYQLWLRALGLNVSLGLMDAWQLAAGDEQTDQQELIKVIVQEAMAEAATQLAAHDIAELELVEALQIFFDIALAAGDAAIAYYRDQPIQNAFDNSQEWLESSSKLRSSVGQALSKASALLTVLEKVSTIGRIGERAIGLAGYLVNVYGVELSPGPSPMETTFLVVGDPFSPVIDSASVPRAASGTEVTFTGSRFHTDPEKNEVHFGSDFPARVLSVSGDGTELAIEVPENASGNPSFTTHRALQTVTFDGFTAVARPGIASVTTDTVPPTSTNPAGKPYAGEAGGTVTINGSRMLPEGAVAAVAVYFDGRQMTDLDTHEAETIRFVCPEMSFSDTGWKYPEVYLRYEIDGNWYETERHEVRVVAPPYISFLAESARPGQQVLLRGLGLDAGFTVLVDGEEAQGVLLEDSRVVGAFNMPATGITGVADVPVEVWNAAGQAAETMEYRQECGEAEDPELPEDESGMTVTDYTGGIEPGGEISLEEALLAARGEIDFWEDGYDDYDQEWVQKWVEVPIPGTDPVEYEWEQQGYVSQETTTRNSPGNEQRYVYRQNFDRNGNSSAPALVDVVNLDSGSAENPREEGDRVAGAEPGSGTRDSILLEYAGDEPVDIQAGALYVGRGDILFVSGDNATLQCTGGTIEESATVRLQAHMLLTGNVTVTGAKTTFECRSISGGQVIASNLQGGTIQIGTFADTPGNALEVTGSANSQFVLGVENAGGWGVSAQNSLCLLFDVAASDCARGGVRMLDVLDSGANVSASSMDTGLRAMNCQGCTFSGLFTGLNAGLEIEDGGGHNLAQCRFEGCADGLVASNTSGNTAEVEGAGCTRTVHLQGGAGHNLLDLRVESGGTGILLTGAGASHNTMNLLAKGVNTAIARLEDGASENLAVLEADWGDFSGDGVVLAGNGTSNNEVRGVLGGYGAASGGTGVRIENGASDNTISAHISNCQGGGIHVGGNIVNTQIENCRVLGNGGVGIYIGENALGTMLVDNEVYPHAVAAIHASNVRDEDGQSMSIYRLTLTSKAGTKQGQYGIHLENCAGVYLADIECPAYFETGLLIDGANSTNMTMNGVRVAGAGVSGATMRNLSSSSSTRFEADFGNAAASKAEGFAGLVLQGCRDLQFDYLSTGYNAGTGLVMDTCQNLAMDELWCNANETNGIIGKDSTGIHIGWLMCTESGENGVVLDNCEAVTLDDLLDVNNTGWGFDLDGCRDFALLEGWFQGGSEGDLRIVDSQDILLGTPQFQALMFSAGTGHTCIQAENSSGIVLKSAQVMTNVTPGAAGEPPVPIIELDTVTDSTFGPTSWRQGNLWFLCTDNAGATVFDVRGDCSGTNIQNAFMTSAASSKQPLDDAAMRHAAVLRQGATGVALLGNYISYAHRGAVLVESEARENLIARNRIVRGEGDAIRIDGNTAVQNRISENVITDNAGKGIHLENGGNHEVAAPVIEFADLSTGTIAGRVDPPPPEGALVEVFADPADEGEELLGVSGMLGNNFSISTEVPLGLELHAVAVHPNGDSSEFGPMHIIEPPSQNFAFFYATSGADNDDVWLRHPKYKNPMRLTQHAARDYMPAPDSRGRGLVFVSERSGNPDLWLMRFDGRPPVRLTTGATAERDPALHGNRLAFAREEEGVHNIYTGEIDFDTGALTAETALTSVTGDDRTPAWSPTGAAVTFASNRAGNWDIWLINSDRRARQNLTEALEGDQYEPAWSPDGRQIAFASGAGALWLMNADGSGAAPVEAETQVARPQPTLLYGRWLCVGLGGAATEIGVLQNDGNYTSLASGAADYGDPRIASAAVVRAIDATTAAWVAAADAGEVNQPPVLNPIGGKQVQAGSQLRFTLTASDPEGDALSFSARNLPPGASFNSSTGTFTWTPSAGDAGQYTAVVFSVADDGLPPKTARESITIAVFDSGEGEGEGEGGPGPGEGETEGEFEGELEGEVEGEVEGEFEGEMEGEGGGGEDGDCACGCLPGKKKTKDFLSDLFVLFFSFCALWLVRPRKP